MNKQPARRLWNESEHLTGIAAGPQEVVRS